MAVPRSREVRSLASKVGGVDKPFSKRAMKFRQMGLHEREVSEDEMVRLMSDEYTFVTRPVTVHGVRATAGFSAKRIDDAAARRVISGTGTFADSARGCNL